MAELIVYVDGGFGGLHMHLTTTSSDFTQLALGGVGSGIGGNWNDIVSSFKVISGTWRFFRDINLQSPFVNANGSEITLFPTSPGTPNALNFNESTPGEFPVLPPGFDNDSLSSVQLLGN
jgi:hypothetical protein